MELTKSLQAQKILKYIIIAFIGSILLTISAKLQTPFTLVPATAYCFVPHNTAFYYLILLMTTEYCFLQLNNDFYHLILLPTTE